MIIVENNRFMCNAIDNEKIEVLSNLNQNSFEEKPHLSYKKWFMWSAAHEQLRNAVLHWDFNMFYAGILTRFTMGFEFFAFMCVKHDKLLSIGSVQRVLATRGKWQKRRLQVRRKEKVSRLGQSPYQGWSLPNQESKVKNVALQQPKRWAYPSLASYIERHRVTLCF